MESRQPWRAELCTITHATSLAKSLDSDLDWATTFAAAGMGDCARIFGRSGNFRRKIIFLSATYRDQGPETE